MAITAQEIIEAAAAGTGLIQNADNMDRDIFCLHMNHRHEEALRGVVVTDVHMDDQTEELWRTFHDKLHSGALSSDPFNPPNHEHE